MKPGQAELPLVSFMIATCNRLGELRKTLRSCLDQSWPAREILVVDNGSHDGTYEAVQAEFPEVDIARFPRNRGSVAARNEILRRAKGKYVIGLDDDSRLVDADACVRIVQRLETEPDLGILSFQVIGPEFPQRMTDEGRLRGQWHCSSFAACGVALRRAVLDRTGMLPEYFFHMYEEPDLCLRTWNAGYRVLQWNDIVVYHEFSPLNRDEHRSHCRHVRNEIASIWMRYPWHLVLPMTLFRAARHLRFAASRGWAWSEPRVWLEALACLPMALKHRQPVRTQVVKIALAVNCIATADPAKVWELGSLSWWKIVRKRLSAPELGPSPRTVGGSS